VSGEETYRILICQQKEQSNVLEAPTLHASTSGVRRPGAARRPEEDARVSSSSLACLPAADKGQKIEMLLCVIGSYTVVSLLNYTALYYRLLLR
jgi:hypothetical protein